MISRQPYSITCLRIEESLLILSNPCLNYWLSNAILDLTIFMRCSSTELFTISLYTSTGLVLLLTTLLIALRSLFASKSVSKMTTRSIVCMLISCRFARSVNKKTKLSELDLLKHPTAFAFASIELHPTREEYLYPFSSQNLPNIIIIFSICV